MLQNLPQYINWTRKAIIQVTGLATSLLTLGLLPAPYSVWVTTGVAILTVVLHFITPNADPPGETPALEGPVVAEDPTEWQAPESETASEVAVGHQQAAPPSVSSPSPTG